jgi:hypothetical protein
MHHSRIKKALLILAYSLIGLLLVLAVLSIKKVPEKINYGASFSVFHSNELDLDWKTTYNAILHDLGVRKFRLSAHWPLTEPQDNVFNWSELDYQIKEAEKVDAKVVLAIGRRLPGWPECHEPDWAKNLSKEDKQSQILEYLTAVVNRYKNSPAVAYWQVENEPFLTVFSKENCGNFLDKEFLQKEVAHVRSLDPKTTTKSSDGSIVRPILVTDSGELSLWKDAYESGDAFGTSVYIYIWNHYVGSIRYPITPAFFRIKSNLVNMFYGNGEPKESILIELSLEPWLLQPIKDTSLDITTDRMSMHKFNEIIEFAGKTGFEDQYLWGAEWWYFMKEKNHPEYWERAKEIFSQTK